MLKLHSLTKTYASAAGSFVALRNVDLEVSPGEFVAIVGKSGSGKSTLLNLAGGIDNPTSGSVSVNGTSIGRLSSGELTKWRGRTVGFVFQFFQLLPTLTAVENVMLPMDFCGRIPVRRRRDHAIELLDRVGVVEQANKLPATLSGGQQQRVAVARALANDPSIVLADEPTGNLDSATAGEILRLLRELASAGTTVMVVTHERDLEAMIDRTVTLSDGVIAGIANGGGQAWESAR